MVAKNPSNRTVSAFDAKNRLGHLLDRVEAGEGQLAEATYFACDEASTVELAVLRNPSECRYVGRLSQTRVEELLDAVRLGQTLGYITPWIV